MIQKEKEHKLIFIKKSKIYKNIIFFWKLKLLKRKNMENLRKNELRNIFSFIVIIMKSSQKT
jgi:hypothetical protein